MPFKKCCYFCPNNFRFCAVEKNYKYSFTLPNNSKVRRKQSFPVANNSKVSLSALTFFVSETVLWKRLQFKLAFFFFHTKVEWIKSDYIWLCCYGCADLVLFELGWQKISAWSFWLFENVSKENRLRQEYYFYERFIIYDTWIGHKQNSLRLQITSYFNNNKSSTVSAISFIW